MNENESKFDGISKVYAQHRPKYSMEFINYLYSDVYFSDNSIIADIGSGTGILTKQLLEKGSFVYAVEPNAEMRAIAEADLSGYDSFASINASAENTLLRDNSVDFVTAAQAFHWFDRLRFRAECNRILRTSGKIILVWNSRDEDSELIQENEMVIRKYCPKFTGFAGGIRSEESDFNFSDFFEGKYDIRVFRNDLTLNEEGFIGRNLASSFALRADDSNYLVFITELKSLFNRYSNDGLLVMPNLTCCYVGSV